ncbi:hypothetical protein SERLA73DRAFT_192103 [Serpula lacrymans var. lacrymans S7.3]|uniref:Uncharacterized protein n=1 Tax=Serpula lacrymans var. lacrymans (strain S7.3) TaxID=936435 RepID=F8QJ01_SERL3|nr:hypothetical protein SERLA73DRAFT_192103 [Serpula lacrymans var. lacrymans S7.3]
MTRLTRQLCILSFLLRFYSAMNTRVLTLFWLKDYFLVRGIDRDMDVCGSAMYYYIRNAE